MIRIRVNEEPQAKGRARLGGWSIYTPKKTKEFELLVGSYAYDQMKKQAIQMFEGPISMRIDMFFPIPKSYSSKKRQDIYGGKLRPIKKPDIDNVAKAILDGLNKILYDDDKQVVELYLRKHYADEAHFIIEAEELCSNTQ